MHIVTLYTSDFAWLGDPCAESMRRAFGTSAVTVYHELLDPARHPSWNKLLALREVVLARKEPVLWLDADCYVHRYFDVAGDIAARWEPLLVGQDWNGMCLAMLAVRPGGVSLLDTVLAAGDVRCNDDFGIGLGAKWEQNTCKALCRAFPGVERRVGLLSHWMTDQPGDDPDLCYPVHHFGGDRNKALFRKCTTTLSGASKP